LRGNGQAKRGETRKHLLLQGPPARNPASQTSEKMPQLILGLHPGIHDAAAAVFVDYELIAAVQLERLTRQKGDGSVYPDA
jgi:hypothetical protein